MILVCTFMWRLRYSSIQVERNRLGWASDAACQLARWLGYRQLEVYELQVALSLVQWLGKSKKGQHQHLLRF